MGEQALSTSMQVQLKNNIHCQLDWLISYETDPLELINGKTDPMELPTLHYKDPLRTSRVKACAAFLEKGTWEMMWGLNGHPKVG